MTRRGYVGILSTDLPYSQKAWTGADYLSANDSCIYVSKAIEKRSTMVGDIEFLLTDQRENVIERDPLLDLLYRPNEVFTGRQFWALWQTYYDLVGEAYVLVESKRELFEASKASALHLLNPIMVKPHFGADGKPTGFEYRTDKGTTNYSPEEIIYTHRPDPKNPLRGLSLLRSGLSAIQVAAQIDTYQASVLKNGGKVDGVFKFKTSLTKQQLSEIEEGYAKRFSEAKKSGRPLFLGGDADYVRMGMSPEEMAYLETKKVTMQDICILTGVPLSVLSATSDSKFDNADADRTIFLGETIRPLLRSLTTALDEKLFPDGRNLSFVDPTPENADAKLKETETAMRSGFMTVNEARERHGLDPLKEGDVIMVPFSQVPLGEGGLSGRSDDSEKRYAKKAEPKDVAHPLADPAMREVYRAVAVKRLERGERKFLRDVRGYFDAQEKRVLDALSPKSLRSWKRKDVIDDVFDLRLEVKLGKDGFTPALLELMRQAGIDAYELAGSGSFVLSDSIVSWLDKRTDLFVNQINDTTFSALKDAFAESLAANEDRQSLIRRVRGVYGDASDRRAALIARTEVHGATQKATVEGYTQAGLKELIWVSVIDSESRPDHAAMDGKRTNVGTPFENGLMFPGDPSAPADQTINCRCVV